MNKNMIGSRNQKKLLIFQKYLSLFIVLSLLISSPLSVYAQVADTPSTPSTTTSDTGSPSEQPPQIDLNSLPASILPVLDTSVTTEAAPVDSKASVAPQNTSASQTQSLTSAPTVSNTPESATLTAQSSLPKIDKATGALTQQIKLDIPSGRLGMQPDLSLDYNSQDTQDGIVGYGWNVSIPYISRLNKTGSDRLYTDNFFTSSLGGELATTSTATTSPVEYRHKIEDGRFVKYYFSNNSWIAYDKSGVKYTFGSTTQAQQYDAGNSSKVYKWMLEEMRDPNGNFVRYEYAKDNNQLYPSRIVYTGNGVTDGVMSVTFATSTRPDPITDYKPGFKVTTNHRITEVDMFVNSSWVRKYNLSYTTGSNGVRSLLSGVQETGRDTNNSTLALPSITFDYEASTTPFVIQNGLTSNALIPTDATGHGKNDISFIYWMNNGQNPSGVVNSTTVTAPEYWAYSGSGGYIPSDTGVRFVDINGDGKADIVRGNRKSDGSDVQELFINGYTSGGGYSWSSAATTSVNVTFDKDTGSGVMNGGMLGNLNGDGLIDYALSRSSGCAAVSGASYLGNGSGWTSTTTDFIITPTSSCSVTVPILTQLVDINGDGLDDLVSTDTSNTVVYLNKGNGWDTTADSRWAIATSTFYITPVESAYTDRGIRFLDLNGDGLVDYVRSYNVQSYISVADGALHVEQGAIKVAYLNTGSGWATSTAYANQLNYITTGTNAGGMWIGPLAYNEYANFNGNGQQYQDVIKTIHYPKGGTGNITYKLTAQTTTNPELPTSLLVVDKIIDNDNNGTTKETDYTYEGGKLVLPTDVRDRKFGGFKTITETTPDTITKTYYNQGDSVDSGTGEQSDGYAQAGRIFREDVINPQTSNSLTKKYYKWDTFDQGSGRTFIYLSHESEQDFDNDGNHKDKATEYTYSTTTGDVLSIVQKGEVVGNDDGSYGDVSGDMITSVNTFSQSTTTPNLSVPTQQTVTDEQGTKARESKFYYDNQAFGLVTLGNKTKDENWATSTTYASTTRVYNSYGLVTSVTDPRAKQTTFSYDSYNFYPATTTNPLSQSTAFMYDYATGKVLRTVDPNGNVSLVTLDPVGRVIQENETDPSGGSSVIKSTTSYNDGVFPSVVTQSNYLDATNHADTYIYSDGLGRSIQTRKEASPSNTFAIVDTLYDSSGRVYKQSLPYFASSTSFTTATSTSYLYNQFAYDALKRITSLSNSVGTTTYAYGPWTTIITDPNGIAKKLTYDAYDRLIQVDENYSSGMGMMRMADLSGGTTIGYTADGKAIKRLQVKATQVSHSGDAKLASSASGWSKNLSGSSIALNSSDAGAFITFTNSQINHSVSLGIGATTTTVSGVETKTGVWANKEITYKNAIASGIDLRIRTDGNRLVKDVVIQTKKSLPTTKGLTDYAVPFKITSDTSINLVSASSSLKALGTFTTSDSVKVVNAVNVIAYIVAPSVRDAKYHNRTDGQIALPVKYELRKDGIYATKLIPMSWLATANYPVEADLTLTAQDNVGDGYMHSDPYPGSWSSQHDSTTGRSANYTGTESRVHSSKYASGGSGQISIARSFLVFDTRSLPSDATINTASLHVLPTWVRDEYNDTYGYAAVYQGRQSATTSVVNLDYALCGDTITNPTRGSDKLDISGMSAGTDVSFTLNSSGKGWITPVGYSKLCLREGHDAENVEVGNIFNGGWDTEGFDFYSADQTGTSQDPYLTIDYITPSGTSTPPTATPYMYDANNNLVQMTDALGNVRHFTYDGLGRRTSAEDLHASADSTFGTYTYTYDVAGNMTSVVDPKSQTINYTYDNVNRPLTEDYTGTGGTEVTYTYDSCTLGIGHLCVASTTATRISNTYNPLGLLATQTKNIQNTNYTATTTYDYQGNQLILTNPDNSQTKYDYDTAGMISKVSYKKSGGSFADIVSSLAYTPTGQVSDQKNQNGTETVLTYDPAHLYRLTNVNTFMASSTGGSNQTVNIYTSAGDGSIRYWNTTSFATAHSASAGRNGGGSGVNTDAISEGNTNWTDGSSHWVVTRTMLPFDTTSIPSNAVIDSAVLHVRGRQYVNGGNISLIKQSQASLTSLADADYGTMDFTKIADDKNTSDFGSSGSMQSWSLNSTGLGFIGKATTTKMAIVTSYDFSGTDPGGGSGNNWGLGDVYTSRASSDKPYLAVTYHTTSGGGAIQNISYVYDANGNITTITDNSDTNAKKTVNFTYDALNRLTLASTTSATSTPYTQSFSYNEIGNLLSKTGAGTYTYAGTSYANPHAPTSVASTTFTYDNNGNLLTDGTITSTYDYLNRLTQTVGSGATTTYAYDSSGQRLYQTVNGTSTLYPFGTYSLTTSTTTTYIMLGSTLVATADQIGTSTPVIHYSHPDHLGSTNIVTDGNGTIIQTLDYYPYGESRINVQVDSSNSSKKYIGQFFDTQTSLSYLNARYYSPVRGQFTSEDPVFWEAGNKQDAYNKTLLTFLVDPQSQNSYGYANGNPITKSDPNGLAAFGFNIGISGDLGAGFNIGSTASLGLNFVRDNITGEASFAVTYTRGFTYGIQNGPNISEPKNASTGGTLGAAAGFGATLSYSKNTNNLNDLSGVSQNKTVNAPGATFQVSRSNEVVTYSAGPGVKVFGSVSNYPTQSTVIYKYQSQILQSVSNTFAKLITSVKVLTNNKNKK